MAKKKNMETGETETPRGSKPTPGGSPAGSKTGKTTGRAAERAVAARNKKPSLSKRDGSRVKAAAERGSQKADNSFKARLKASRDKAKPSRGRQVKEAEEGVSKANPSKRTPDGGDYAAARRVRVARGEHSSKEIGGKNYGHTGSRNAKTAPIDDYITMMAAETGDQYVRGAGRAGAATSKKSTGKAPAKPQSKQGSTGASRGRSSNTPSQQRSSGSRASSTPSQGRSSNTSSQQRSSGGGNKSPSPQKPKANKAPKPSAGGGNIGPMPQQQRSVTQPSPNHPPQYGPPQNPFVGMQAAQGMMQGMGGASRPHRGPQGGGGPVVGLAAQQAMQNSPVGQFLSRAYRNVQSHRNPPFPQSGNMDPITNRRGR